MREAGFMAVCKGSLGLMWDQTSIADAAQSMVVIDHIKAKG